ncbi:MAG: decaprenyl-phosphate phosphoribosyltransferase [Gammaproteobacteria bacterium]|nr:decaprenyl-phosphate phosphoribosyltransferase [Gammaproteobacteria bacterium]
MRDWIKLLRPQHYVKNGFVLLPLFFAGSITDTAALYPAMIAFAAFCLVASAVYIINDARDVELDRLHPEKCMRPLASGRIPLSQAYIAVIILVALATGMTLYLLSANAAMLLAAYLIMNIGYSFGLKAIAILDISMVSMGFVLRLLVGASAAHIPLSHWIITMTFLLSLFLALAKRRDDVQLFLTHGDKTRKSVDGYSMEVVNHGMSILAAVVIVAYLMYCTSPEVQAQWDAPWLYATGGWVVLGVMRYLQITHIEENSGNPTKVLLKDRFVQFTVLAWVASFGAIIYM